MDITKIYVGKNSGGVSVGYGSVTFDNALIVRFGIMKNKEGKLFVNWPSKKGKDDKWYADVSFVVDESAENPYAIKNNIDSEIIKEFNKVLGTTTSTETKQEQTEFNYGKEQEEPKEKGKKASVRWKQPKE